MKNYVKLISLFSLFFGFVNVQALESADHEKIVNIVHGYAHAWNKCGGKGFADNFAEDADFVNIFGMHFSGKKEIEERHIQILAGMLKGTELLIENVKLREVKPGLVVAIVNWKLKNAHKRASSKRENTGIFSHAFVKNGDHWEIVLCQNTFTSTIPFPLGKKR